MDCKPGSHTVLLSELQMREERSKQYFETDINLGDDYGYNEMDELYDRVGYIRYMICVQIYSTVLIDYF